MTICYSSRYSGIIGVYLNGVRVHSLAFTATGTGSAAWTGPGHFKTIVLDMVLSEGDSLKIQFDSGDAILNIDYIECNFAAARYEAESAALSGNASVFTGQVNASGYSVVGNINAAGSSVLFADLPETSSVSLRYASANSGTINLYVNGTHSKTLVFSSTGSWSVFKTIALELSISAGSSLKVQFNSGDMALNLDYIELDPLISIPGSPGGEIIAAGPLHTLMTDSYSSFFYVWGGNSEGELGNGTATGSLKPVWMNHMTDFVAVSAGGDSYTGTYFSAALKTDGTVWTWGGNDFGQLGNGATVGSSTPVQVSGLSDIVAVSCVGSHMTALKSDGTVWTWGNNQYGQLGNGTVTGSSTP
ncbi:MAG TPA: DUF5010 C-terminal domain-containing protein, partial [Oscillospiraceae bacterium]|nr:DUF5010 C-terminal domain-containing protein [Oscillospiraceae bacterium]